MYTPVESANPTAVPAPLPSRNRWLRPLLRWGLPLLALLLLLLGSITSPQSRFFVTERFQTRVVPQ